MIAALSSDFEANGFEVIPDFLPVGSISSLIQDFENQRYLAGGGHSLRNVHRSAVVQHIVREGLLTGIVESLLGMHARLVRAIYFDKLPEANWSVPWHQDLTIAVNNRHEMPGYGPWSQKDGVWHVQPPAEILGEMVTIRIHLDDCGIDNGPVRVKAGSHLHGRIPEPQVNGWPGLEVPCIGARGSALVMRPLILHASSPSLSPNHRRVLHLEYAGCDLPSPLRWYLDSHFPG